MNDQELTVELMGTGRNSSYLDVVYNPQSNEYYFPETPQTLADLTTLTQDISPDAIAMAFIDSGMLTEHPVIRPRLRHSVDFTGEGPEDHNGHGTLVTLIAVGTAPMAALVNIKVVDGRGHGKMEWLVKGLEWCTANAARYNIKVVNLSAGIYHKKWGFLECNADCDVCKAAKALHESGVMLVAAAGNEGPDELPCPQRTGLRENTFMVVQAIDVSGDITKYSGQGNIAAPEARIRRVPVGQ